MILRQCRSEMNASVGAEHHALIRSTCKYKVQLARYPAAALPSLDRSSQSPLAFLLQGMPS